MAAIKLSVSLSDDVVAWLNEQASEQHKSLSAVLNDTVRQARRERALDEVLEWLDAPQLSAEQLAEFRRRWGLASPSTPAPSSRSNDAGSRPRRRSAPRGK